MKEYEIRDTVYGFIRFNEWEKEIIDHPVFQRLRKIKQLAFTDMVYPGAQHTRFEHSLGVMHLATLIYDVIVKDNTNKQLLKDKLNYNEAGLQRDRQLVRLAALLHDIGHAPFSHASEELMEKNPKTNRLYKHEDYTITLIKMKLRDAIENHSVNKINFKISADEVAALIEGNPEVLEERIFWKVIISSQLDADRGDYLLRDSHHIGVKYGVYDLNRLLVTISLGIDPETEDIILGVKEGGWHIAESLIIARYQMFTQVYFHKTRRAYDYMLQKAMKDTINFLPPPEKIEKFLKLDDYLLWNLFKQKKSYWCNSLLNRNHLRVVYKTKEEPTVEDEKTLDNIKELLTEKEIWYWEDNAAKKVWYKLNVDEGGKNEIMVIDKNKNVIPLSEYSSIVKNLGELRQIRIYVKPEDREKAEEIIKEAIV